MEGNNKHTSVALETAPHAVCKHIFNNSNFVEYHNLLLKALNQILADKDKREYILGKDYADNFDGVTAIGQIYDGMVAVTIAYCAENYIEGEPDSMWSDNFVLDMKRIAEAHGKDVATAEKERTEIWRICVPECPYNDFEVGKNDVVAIEEKHVAVSSCAETQAQSTRLVYEVTFNDGWTLEVGADMKGLIVYRRKYNGDNNSN